MLCKHGNTAPCVECDIEPLKAENESLRRDISALVEALEEIAKWTERYTAPEHPITTVARKALAAYRKGVNDEPISLEFQTTG